MIRRFLAWLNHAHAWEIISVGRATNKRTGQLLARVYHCRCMGCGKARSFYYPDG